MICIEEYDVIIIGTGPAGLSAGIYCSRANLKTLVLGHPEKSQAQMARHIENYFGFPEGVDGAVLVNKGIIHCKKFGAVFLKEDAVNASALERGGRPYFTVKTSGNKDMGARALMIATGIPIKYSGIKSEEKLTGKGIHYCVSCDGPLYHDKSIVIIGNGNHAAEDAIEALSYTKDVTIIANAGDFQFSDAYDKEITKWQIKTVLGKVKEFRGEKWLESVVMEDGKELKYSGVFMACGAAGALDFAANLGLEIKDNVLVTDENGMTSMEGVFAAGNCAGRCRQIAKNVGDGCNAAMNAIKYLRSRSVYMDYGEKTAAVAAADSNTASENEKQTEDDSKKTGIKKEVEEILQISQAVQAPAAQKKLRIGWFSFSCCEDSTIVFTELLNDYYDKWKDVVEIAYCRPLKKNNSMENLDVAFVEGAISNPKAEDELKKIRQNSKKLVAIGACAITGMPSGQRNTFDERKKKEIDPIIRAFDYSKNVRTLHEIVAVDDNVPGCPMTETGFLTVVGKCLKEFGIDA